MAEKPILFSAEMIQAVLDGRKTQTRRVVKLPLWSTGDWDDFELDEFGVPLTICEKTTCWAEVNSPYGRAGDNLWVRETWRTHEYYNPVAPRDLSREMPVQYKADLALTGTVGVRARWRPSIFMPRWASRINLRVNEVRVERLRDITLADILAEGCPVEHRPESCNGMSHAVFGWFEHLWDSINHKRGYGRRNNPFVWVIKFSLD
jgi:hypothetical protein